MSDEKALTLKQQNLTPDTWAMIKEVAPAMTASHLFGVSLPEQAMAIMLKGYELGLSLTASFEFIQVIQGKPALSPRGTLALIQQSPNFAGMKIQDIKDSSGNPQSCKVWMKRANGFEYTTEYTVNEAQQAGLIKPDSGWSKYPANMLRWRAIGYCADVVFPDVIGGMKRIDEMGADITPEGNVWQSPAVVEVKPQVKPQPVVKVATLNNNPQVIQVKAEYVTTDNEGNKTSVVNNPPVVSSPTEEIPQYGYTLQKLLESVPDSDMLEVMNGEFPVTPEQINMAVHLLVKAGKINVSVNQPE
jgi:hypothetical protein